MICRRAVVDIGGVGVRTREGCSRTGRRLAHRVEFGEPADVGHQPLVLARCGVRGADLGEGELQPVGFLGHLAGAVDPVDEVPPGDQPLVAQLPIALQSRCRTGEPVQRRALLVGPHEPQLVVLAVQCQQTGGEGGESLGRHAAPAEVGPRGPVPADRPQRDDAAVVIAVGAGGFQDPVDLGGGQQGRVRRW